MIERAEKISAASVGLTIAEGKALLASLQKQIVTAQVEQHVASIKSCPQCGHAFRTKSYYQSTLRSVYGKVGMRIRRLRACPCSGSQAHSFSTLFTNKSPITPELRYLTAKMAAVMPFRKVADFLGELLPLPAQATASTVRNRTMKVGRRLQRSAKSLVTAASSESCSELVVGFDGGYVRNRAKWRLWNGLAERGIVGLIHLGQFAQAPCFEPIPSLKKLAHTLLETIRYLELNADSLPDYGKRYRGGQRISTGVCRVGGQ